jgi:5-methylcytosine-specific restriction endonuclease McrA
MDFSEELANGYREMSRIMSSPEWQRSNYPNCGTKNGHRDHHRKYKDEPCEPCMEAMRKYWRDHRAKPEAKAKYAEYNRTNRKMRNGTRFKKLISQGFTPEKDYFSANTVIQTYGTDCHLCGEAIDLDAPRTTGRPGWERSLHVDHVIPLSKGGDDTLENVRPSHGKCNIRKHNKVM